jgi:stage V sporulation protein SpoVS
MAQNVDNIIQGAAEIYLAPAPKTAISAAGAGVSQKTVLGTFVSVGYTGEGLDITFEPDYLDVEVDTLLDSAALFKTKQKVTIATSFAEATLENLAFVLGQKASTVAGAQAAAGDTKAITIDGGALGSGPEERSFLAVGPSVRDIGTVSATEFTERVYYAPRVISVESVSVAVKRNEATMFPVTFRCLPDSTSVGSEYGKVIDRLYGT